jgi:hypothetical protein
LKTYVDALAEILDQLRARPLEWGDPLYKTKTPGGVVLRGVAYPLRIHYVVFESLNRVLIFDMAPLPHSPLADS